MSMHNPPHPGEILKEMYFRPLQEKRGLTITKAAKSLGVTRQTLSELMNLKTGISTDMAIRLSIAFNTTPQYWLNLQITYDLWCVEHSKRIKGVHRLVA